MSTMAVLMTMVSFLTNCKVGTAIFLILNALLLTGTEAAGCLNGTFGSDCRRECHCDVTNLCDSRTGSCANGCSKIWSGPICQRKNVAFGKPTGQLSTSYHGMSGNAVDGSSRAAYDAHQHKFSCSHTAGRNQVSPWWYVDLLKPSAVYAMRIFNRDDQNRKWSFRLWPFQVYVSDVKNYMKGRLCYEHDGSAFISLQFTCFEVQYGRYVYVILKNRQHPLTICEFEVYECADYWYGPLCVQQCECLDRMEVCDKVTGSCRSGCAENASRETCRPRSAKVIFDTIDNATSTPGREAHRRKEQNVCSIPSEQPKTLIITLALLLTAASILLVLMTIYLVIKDKWIKRIPLIRLKESDNMWFYPENGP